MRNLTEKGECGNRNMSTVFESGYKEDIYLTVFVKLRLLPFIFGEL
jgi:hypothetical protein